MTDPLSRLGTLSPEAVACRQLRHAWPRPPSELIRLIEDHYIDGRPVVVREMACAGGCGTIAVENFERRREGGWRRLGIRTYRRMMPYLLTTIDDDGEPLPKITSDDIATAFMQAFFPELAATTKQKRQSRRST